MRIWVKPDLLAKLGLTVPDINQAVQQQSSVNPAGQVGAEPAPKGQELTYTVRAQGGFKRRRSSARSSCDPTRTLGRALERHLPDRARGLSYKQVGRLNASPPASSRSFRRPVRTPSPLPKLKKTMAELKQRFPADLDYAISLDLTLPVTEGSERSSRPSAPPSFSSSSSSSSSSRTARHAHPHDCRAGLVDRHVRAFPLLGFSINTLSLFGLILAVGLVVDDAIVVVEAVEHHIEEGMSPRDATLQAMNEVSGPVVGIALILASVFIPVAFMSGIQGAEQAVRRDDRDFGRHLRLQRVNPLAGPVCAALEAAQGVPGADRPIFAGFNQWFARVTHGYVNVSTR